MGSKIGGSFPTDGPRIEVCRCRGSTLFALSATRQMLCRLAARLMQHPAAPYHEHAVRAEVKRICVENGLDYEQDRFGNLLVRLETAKGQRVFVLAAHLDHPGFSVTGSVSSSRCQARFEGGVPEHYFRPGVALRLMPGAEHARLGGRRG